MVGKPDDLISVTLPELLNPPVQDWYTPGEISFAPEQICWLIDHIRTLRSGCYPRGLTGEVLGKGKLHTGAYFEIPILLYTELTTRLQKCGIDGVILLLREGLDMTEDEIASYLNQSVYEVGKRAATALRYVSGKGRKWQKRGKWEPISYREFKSYHRKKNIPY